MSDINIEIIDNQTRYCSKDLIGVFKYVIAKERQYDSETFTAGHDIASMVPTRIKIRSYCPQNIGAGPLRNDRHSPYNYRYGFSDEVVLKLRAPKHLPEEDAVRSLVHSVDGKTYLPRDTVKQIAWWYYCQFYLSHISNTDNMMSQDSFDPPEVAVLRNIVDSKKFLPKTHEEKLESLKEKHGDPGYIMGGSSRTPDYHWHQDLGVIRNYYNREWVRREKWRAKIEKLGEERKAHLSFADYLRLCAHYLDANGRLP